MEDLTEDERRALRGSKFAPLPAPPPSSRPQPRLAHPGGPLATNKAAALAKFLERKLQEPNGLSSLNPALVEQAVKNAKDTVTASTSSSGRVIRHVASFGDLELPDSEAEDEKKNQSKVSEKKPKKYKKKNNKKKEEGAIDCVEVKDGANSCDDEEVSGQGGSAELGAPERLKKRHDWGTNGASSPVTIGLPDETDDGCEEVRKEDTVIRSHPYKKFRGVNLNGLSAYGHQVGTEKEMDDILIPSRRIGPELSLTDREFLRQH